MNIIDPSTIDLLVLPSVTLEQRASLPTSPCIYFAINNEGIVQYIGISNNPRKRWKAHHRGVDLALLGGVRIAYIECDALLLPEIERELIAYFCPPLNQPIGNSRPVSHPHRKTRRSSPALPPTDLSSKRNKGLGTGRIQWRTITKPSGKQYQQPWYDYEIWSKGLCLLKKTKYIPKRLVAKIQEMESEKAPVREILKLLGVKT